MADTTPILTWARNSVKRKLDTSEQSKCIRILRVKIYTRKKMLRYNQDAYRVKIYTRKKMLRYNQDAYQRQKDTRRNRTIKMDIYVVGVKNYRKIQDI